MIVRISGERQYELADEEQARLNELDGSLRVVVVDARAGTAFEVTAPQDNALDVFYHPYAYAREAA